MSDVIDQRVVEMGFDNKEFEKGISQSLLSLDKLNEALNFSKSLDAFDGITKAIKKVSFDPMVTMWQTALTRITNYAINAGHRITKALTIDPVFTGFQEYTTQIDAVQTILANTEKYGTTLNDVNKALDELNLYADKTIYNFTQMTSNIGRFTAAGLQLDTSVKSIEGMSNLAASSGATAEQASRAYYQMSQALAGVGLRLMDYNSLVNAGMGGVLFQDALKQTARDVKAVTEEYSKLSASGMSNVDIAKKFGVTLEEVDKILGTKYSADVDAIVKKKGSFRESLGEGWATADILARTFSKFSSTGMIDYLHEFTGVGRLVLEELQEIGNTAGYDSDEFNKFADSIKDVTEEQRKEIKMNLKQAQTAEDAATKVKTFAQLKDTIKEAVQSGWTQTWEYIIGDFEEAKEFFTQISDFLGGIISKYSDFRNDIVGDWSKGGGRKALIDGLWNVVHALESVIKPLGTAWKNVFPDINVANVLISVSEAISTLTSRLMPNEKVINRVTVIYEKIFTVFDSMRGAVGDLIHLMPKLENALNHSIFAGVFTIFENTADANYRGKMVKGWRDIYHLLDDMSDMEIKIPGEDDKKGKLANSNAFVQTLKSLADMISRMQKTDVSKLSSANDDISKLNENLLEMAYGLKNGNDIFKNFKLKDQTDFLKYLQEEYGLEADIAENVYKTVKKLSDIEDRIFQEATNFANRIDGFKITSLKDVAASAVSKIFGVSPEKFLNYVEQVNDTFSYILNRLKDIFATTIAGLVTIDLLLSKAIVMLVKSVNDYILKPVYDYLVTKWGPIFNKLYESLRKNLLPILNSIFTGVLGILEIGLTTFINKFPSLLDKAFKTLELFMDVATYFADKVVDKITSLLDALATMDLKQMVNYLFENLKNGIFSLPSILADFFSRLYSTFKDALRLNGVSEKVIKIFDTIYGAISFVFNSLYNLIPLGQQAYAGIYPTLSKIFGMISGFIEKNGVSVKSFGAIVISLIGVFFLVKKLADTINNTVNFAHKVSFLNDSVSVGPWPFSIILKPIVDSASQLGKFLDIWGRFTALLDMIQGTFQAIIGFIKTMEVVSIIGVIVALIGAIYMLSTLPSDVLMSVVGAIGAVLVLITVMIVAITNLTDKLDLAMMGNVIGAVGVFILSIAGLVGTFALIKMYGGDAMAGVGTVLLMLVALTAITSAFIVLVNHLNKFGSWLSTGVGIGEVIVLILGIAAMSYVFLPLVAVFGLIPWNIVVQGILALIGVCVAIGVFIALAKNFKGEDAIDAGVAIALFSVGIGIVSVAVIALSKAIDTFGAETFGNATIFLLGVMGLMDLFIYLVGKFGDPEKYMITALAMSMLFSTIGVMALSFAGALAILKTAFGDNIDLLNKILTGFGIFVGIFVLLGSLVGLIGLIPGAAEVLGISALILAAIGSMALTMGLAVLSFGTGLYLIGQFMETLVDIIKDDDLASKIEDRTSVISNAIFTLAEDVTAASVSLISSIYDFLNDVLPELDNVLMYILNWWYTNIPKYEAELLKIIYAMLYKLSVYIRPILNTLLAIIKDFIDLVIPFLRQNLATWLVGLDDILRTIEVFILSHIVTFLGVLKTFAPSIAVKIIEIINDVTKAILSAVDPNTGNNLFMDTLKNVGNMASLISQTLTEALIKGILLAILALDKLIWLVLRTLLVGLIENTLDMLNDFFEKDAPTLITKLETLTDNVINTIILFMDTLAKKIEEHTEPLVDSAYNLGRAIGRAILKFFKKLFDPNGDEEESLPKKLLVGAGTAILNFVKGIVDNLWKVGNAIRDLYLKVKTKFEELFGFSSDGEVTTGSKIYNFGISLISGFSSGVSTGIANKIGDIKESINTIYTTVTDILNVDDFKQLGTDLITAFVLGASAPLPDGKTVPEAIRSVFSGVLPLIDEMWDRHSPPGEFIARGKELPQAVLIGAKSEEKNMNEGFDGIFSNLLNLAKSIFGGDDVAEEAKGFMSKIGEALGFSDTDNPITSFFDKFVDNWDENKGFIANISDTISGIFNSDGVQSFFDKIKEYAKNVFGVDIDPLAALGLKDENGNYLWDNLPSGYTGLTDSYKADYTNGIGETLSSGKLDTSKVNNRTITSNGTYANTMNDMFNSGKYWNDPNALTNADIVNAIATVVQRLDNIDENMPKEVVLDTGAMVGNLSPEMNRALGRMLRQKGRRT